uniref:FLYWCH-type domain-containing protein n=1 Tax=Glossina pallidipes TaxID=7398 RepID=A0A1A9ZT85_GLOPL
MVNNPEDVLVFFTQSLRGRPAIMANGVRFLIMSENKKKILWRCSSMATKKIKCPARITMLKETPPKFIINKAQHVHAELKRNKYGSSKHQLFSVAKIDGTMNYQILNPAGSIVTTATAHSAQRPTHPQAHHDHDGHFLYTNIYLTLNLILGIKREPENPVLLDEINYVISQKGRTQLLHKGYYYVREKKIRNKVYWRCTQYTTWFRCHGRLHTDEGRIVHSSLHNHNCLEGGEKPNMHIKFNLATFSSTKKKNRKLLIGDYEYVIDRTLKQSTNWRCARYKSARCRARATTRINADDLEQLALKRGIMITRGSKGKPKLMLAGYAYFQNNRKGSKIYWLCAKNRYCRCKARIITCSLSGELMIKNQDHNHGPADPDKYESD